jgi:hypothetical protein
VRGRVLIPLALAAALPACGVEYPLPERTERLRVGVRLANGDPVPGPSDPVLPLPLGIAELRFDVEALRLDGNLDPSFSGFARISVEPGTVVELAGPQVNGRNVLLENGKALDQIVRIRNARGITRIWAEDVGYVPEDPRKPPACANGIDDDGDGAIDYPDDPGCALANDDTETGGSHATGVSPPVRFARPRLADVQGRGATTPYALEGVEVDPVDVIVTRIASDGFYATDLADRNDYGHIFAFTFNTPGGLRVCDRIEALSGTASEFFGFTELSFPSFDRHAWVFPGKNPDGTVTQHDGPCQVPEPIPIHTGDPQRANFPENDTLLEPIESALVRVENVTIGAFFGPERAHLAVGFGPNRSSCDLDNNGLIDFQTPGNDEATCANNCADNPECVEWTGYMARGNYRVVFENNTCTAMSGQRPCTIQVNTRSVSQFDPPAMRGRPIRSLTGTLRNFSGGSRNWTIETRCSADLVCDSPDTGPAQVACDKGPAEPVSSQIACVLPRTIHDPDEATN